jgi:hypothetical protein
MVAADQALTIGKYFVVVLHHRVGWQTAVLDRQRHRSAFGVEAQADLAGRCDLG